jgi:hypothetical protein
LVHLGASSSRNLRPTVSVHKSTKPCHWPFMISRSATPVASCFITSIAIGFTTPLPCCSAPHGTTDIQQPPVTSHKTAMAAMGRGVTGLQQAIRTRRSWHRHHPTCGPDRSNSKYVFLFGS